MTKVAFKKADKKTIINKFTHSATLNIWTAAIQSYKAQQVDLYKDESLKNSKM